MRRRYAVLLGLIACLLVVTRVVWELAAPLSFHTVKSAIYWRDALTLIPAGCLAVYVIVRMPAPHTPYLARPRLVVTVAALSAFVISAAIARFGLLGVPHVADEAAYLWQAQLLRHGHLWGSPTPFPHDTLIEYVTDIGPKRLSVFFPGSAAPLAVGYLVGKVVFVDPFLTALLVVVTYWAGRRLFDSPTGLLAAALAVFSPFVLFQGASYFGHVWTALFAMAAFTLALAPRRRIDVLTSGALTGVMLLSRPVSALVLSLIVVASITLGVREGRARQLLMFAAGFVPLAITFAAMNHSETGSWSSSVHSVVLSNERAQLNVHALKNALLNIAGLTIDLSGLTIVTLALVALALRSRSRPAVAIVSYAVLQLAVYSLYYNNGISYGPRYLFEAAPLLLVLAARGALKVPRFKERVVPLVGVAALVTLAAVVPTRLEVFHQRGKYLELPHVPAGPALVFVGASSHRFPDPFYSAFVHNGPSVGTTRVVYVRDDPPDRCALQGMFPGRSTYGWRPDEGTFTALEMRCPLTSEFTSVNSR